MTANLNRNRRPTRRTLMLGTIAVLASVLFVSGGAHPGAAKEDGVALDYYRTLAEGGSADAQLVLGDLYRDGSGVPQDLVEAYAWYYLAAQQGIEEAIYPMNEVLRQLPEHRWGEARKRAEAYEKKFIPAKG